MSIRAPDLLFVSIGGMVGALSRVAAGALFDPMGLGLGLFLANLSGALFLALISVWSARLAPQLRVFLGTGFCGSFTSVSALNVIVALQSNSGNPVAGWLYGVVSIASALCLVSWVLRWHPDGQREELSR